MTLERNCCCTCILPLVSPFFHVVQAALQVGQARVCGLSTFASGIAQIHSASQAGLDLRVKLATLPGVRNELSHLVLQLANSVGELAHLLLQLANCVVELLNTRSEKPRGAFRGLCWCWRWSSRWPGVFIINYNKLPGLSLSFISTL